MAAFRRGDFVDLPKKTAKFQAVLLSSYLLSSYLLSSHLLTYRALAYSSNRQPRCIDLSIPGGPRPPDGGCCASPLAIAPGACPALGGRRLDTWTCGPGRAGRGGRSLEY